MRQWRELLAQKRAADSTRGIKQSPLDAALSDIGDLWYMGAPVDGELARLDAALRIAPLASRPPVDRPYLTRAGTFAALGQLDRAHTVLAQYRAEVRDTALLRSQQPTLHANLAHIALAERRWADAVREFRAADRLPDGPVDACQVCLTQRLVITFAEANMPDSALVEYERYRRTPFGQRQLVGPDLFLGPRVTEAMAKIYDAKGDTVKAVQHYRWYVELFKKADPELQPRVAEAQQRLKKLTPVERPRR